MKPPCGVVEYVYVGIPLALRKGKTRSADRLKVNMSDFGETLFKIEYLKLERKDPCLENLQMKLHFANRVDLIERCLSDADKVIVNHVDRDARYRVAFVNRDDEIIVLYQDSEK